MGTKVITVCPKDAPKAFLWLSGWVSSLTDVLDAMTYTQALEHAQADLMAVESVLVLKLSLGDYGNCASTPPVGGGGGGALEQEIASARAKVAGLEAQVSYYENAVRLAAPEDKVLMEYLLDNLEIELDAADSYLQSLL